jgi:hypothetical protein
MSKPVPGERYPFEIQLWLQSAELHSPRGLDEGFAPACVAGHDAPLIGERAATRGRSAKESGDAHAGPQRLRPTARPGTRTLANTPLRLRRRPRCAAQRRTRRDARTRRN